VQLSDGACSSTCPIFANLLINQGKVKTVTAGGRPKIGPISVIGGTQGANVLSYSIFKLLSTAALAGIQDDQTLSPDEKAKVKGLLSPLVQPAPINYSKDPSVNYLDNIGQGDKSMTPLQFNKSPTADCRFFYMPQDILGVENTWTRVAKGIRAGGTGLCINATPGNSVNGTITGGNGTVTGGKTPPSPITTASPGTSSSSSFTGAAVPLKSTGLPWLLAASIMAALTALM